MRNNEYQEGIKYNMTYKTYGKAYAVPKKLIITSYSVLAVVIPVVVPVFIIPLLIRYLPNKLRMWYYERTRHESRE